MVLLTYTALARTRMNEAAIRQYAEQTEAIRREVRLRQRNAKDSKKLTERQQAILKEGVASWLSEQMELPEGWAYDPGVAWDDIGIDLLVPPLLPRSSSPTAGVVGGSRGPDGLAVVGRDVGGHGRDGPAHLLAVIMQERRCLSVIHGKQKTSDMMKPGGRIVGPSQGI